ncbi:MAG: type II toxin-antitoxin system VapC family toxin [Acidobacteriota bacterium]|nr:type II toxin-antitoxin system VapC family toxin [Acidobacteriota bacterium]
MKVVLDTNVLIAFFRDPRQRAQFESRYHRPLLFMSSVVAPELFVGCRTQQQEKALTAFLKPFEKAARIVTPDHACFREAGRVLAGLGRAGIGTAHRHKILNDVLIAVTAARSGLMVVTSNAGDFSLIEKYTPVRWMRPD